MVDRPEWVYIIGYADEDGGPVKIGLATHLRQRLFTLQTGNHRELRVLDRVCGGRDIEHAIQDAVKDHRIRWEWYDCRDLLEDMFITFNDELNNDEEPTLALVASAYAEAVAIRKYIAETGDDELEFWVDPTMPAN